MATGQGNIVITADTSQAQRALGDLDRALNGLKSSTSFATKAFAAVAGAAGIGALITQSLDLAGALQDSADALGMSASALGVLQKGAKLVGVDAEALNGSITKLNKNIGEALIKGTGGAVDALKRLGLSAKDLANMDTESRFKAITERLAEIPNPAVRAALAVELLGKQGPKMLQVAESAKALKQELIDLGIKLNDTDIKVLDDAGDAIDKAGMKLKEGFMKALVELAPAIISVANAIGDMAPYIVKVTKLIIELAPYMAAAFGGYMLANIGKIAGAISGVLVNAVRALTAAMAANPLTALLVALTTLGTYVYTKFVRPLSDAGESAGTIFKYVADKMVNYMLNGLEILITIVPRTFKMLYTAAKKIWSGEDIADAIRTSFSDALTDVGNDWNKRRVKFVSDEEMARLDGIRAKYNEAGKAGEQAVQQVTAATDELNEAQQKALKSLADTILKLQDAVDLEANRAKYGVATADAMKMIAEEERKLAEVGLKLSQQDRDRITALNQQLEINKKINESVQNGIKYLEESPGYNLNGIKNAYKDLENSRKAQNADAILGNEARLTREVIAYASSIDEEYRILAEWHKKESEINDFGHMLRKLGYEEDTAEFKAYLSAKEALQSEHIMKLVELDKKQFENRKFLEIQNGKNSQFGYETKKQMAKEAADFEMKSDMEKYAFGLDQASQMFTALGAQNKKAFEAAKAFNIANAIMNTYMAATKALATYPPPFNFIAMAAAIGMGMAQVAAIRSQQYSGRALGGPVMGGQSYIVGENGPELFTPNTTGSITRNQDLQGGGSVNVNFSINAVDTAGFDELLNSRRGLITQVISDAMVEKGQRGL